MLLLEAYEQLERDVGAEVDRALSKQVCALDLCFGGGVGGACWRPTSSWRGQCRKMHLIGTRNLPSRLSTLLIYQTYLNQQAEELSKLQRRVGFLEDSLQKERVRGSDLEEGLAVSEARCADAAARCEAYESGVYGLPQVRGSNLLVVIQFCVFAFGGLNGAKLRMHAACVRVPAVARSWVHES